MKKTDTLKAVIEPMQRPDWGFFTICQKINGKMKQRAYTMNKFEEVMSNLDLSIDTYISQNVFNKPNRQSANLQSITHAYVDLDTYNVARLAGSSVDDIVAEFLLFCGDNDIPLPSMIIDSGRGLYLKYIWSTRINGRAAGRAIAVNRKLVEMFESFGADPKCVDMSRILRVVGSTNTKNGRTCNIAWMAKGNSEQPVKTYNFDAFADEILPYTYEEVKAYKAKKKNKPFSPHQSTKNGKNRSGSLRSWKQYHRDILHDLQTLKHLRYKDGYIPEGKRNLFGYLGALQIAHVTTSEQDLLVELQDWTSKNNLFAPSYIQTELRSACGSIVTRQNKKKGGEYHRHDGKKITPLYTYKIETLIRKLVITPEEMKQMSVLINKPEKQRRDTARHRRNRRKQGKVSRDVYIETAAQKKKMAQQLRASGLSLATIAKKMGVSKSSVHGYVKSGVQSLSV